MKKICTVLLLLCLLPSCALALDLGTLMPRSDGTINPSYAISNGRLTLTGTTNYPVVISPVDATSALELILDNVCISGEHEMALNLQCAEEGNQINITLIGENTLSGSLSDYRIYQDKGAVINVSGVENSKLIVNGINADNGLSITNCEIESMGAIDSYYGAIYIENASVTVESEESGVHAVEAGGNIVICNSKIGASSIDAATISAHGQFEIKSKSHVTTKSNGITPIGINAGSVRIDDSVIDVFSEGTYPTGINVYNGGYEICNGSQVTVNVKGNNAICFEATGAMTLSNSMLSIIYDGDYAKGMNIIGGIVDGESDLSVVCSGENTQGIYLRQENLVINNGNVLVSAGRAVNGDISCGAGIIAQHKDGEEDEWITFIENTTDKKYFRSGKSTLLATPVPPATPTSTPNLNQEGLFEFKGHYYKIYMGEYTWDQTMEMCEGMEGHLVTITSAEEQAFIESINKEIECLWIGGYRDENDNWHWVTDEEWSYTNWRDGEPNDSGLQGEGCAAIWPKQWNDLHWSNTGEQTGYICEWENEPTLIVPPTPKPTPTPTITPVPDPTPIPTPTPAMNQEGAVAFEGNLYKILTGEYTWNEADALCQKMGGHLVTITSTQEQEFIEVLNADNLNLWIGGYRDENHVWYWVTGEKWGYTNWGDDEPNNMYDEGEDCAAIWPVRWNDLNRNNMWEQVGFVCEWETSSVQTPTPTVTPMPTVKPDNYFGNSREEIINIIGYSPEYSYDKESTGIAVLFIQTVLDELGYYEGVLSGSFGNSTKAALITFQQKYGLPVTGICDAQTMYKLMDAYVGGIDKTYEKTFYNPEWFRSKDKLIEIGLKKNAVVLLTDLRTDTTFRIKVESMGNHIDAEPLTAADTRAMCRIYGVSSAQELVDQNHYKRRPMLLTIPYQGTDIQIVCSMYGVPKGADTIVNNNYDGNFCIHLSGSKLHAVDRVCEEHTKAIAEAVELMKKKTNTKNGDVIGDKVSFENLPPVDHPTLVFPDGMFDDVSVYLQYNEPNASGHNTVVYNVHLVDSEGVELELPGECILCFPYPEGMDENSANKFKIAIHHYSSKGTETFNSKDGTIELTKQGLCIRISSFSPFEITWEEIPEEIVLPKTGDTSLPMGFLLMVMIVSLCGLGLMAKRKRN